MSCTLNVGLPSSGKTYNMVTRFHEIVLRNNTWYKKKKIQEPRQVWINQRDISKEFLEKYPFINIYKDIDEIIYLENCDIFIDEVSNYFDARDYQNLSFDSKIFLSQYKKWGNTIFATTQDPMQVDVLFRKKVTAIRYFSKGIFSTGDPTPTKPKIKNPFAWFLLRPATFKYNDKGDLELLITRNPLFLGIRWTNKKILNLYNRSEKVQKSETPKLKHYEYYCEHYQQKGHEDKKCFSKPVKLTHK